MIAYQTGYDDFMPTYYVVHGDGKVEEDVQDLPFPVREESILFVDDKEPFHLEYFQNSLGRSFEDLDDFAYLVNSEEYNAYLLNDEGWRNLAISFLKQLAGVINAKHIPNLPPPSHTSQDPIAQLLAQFDLFINSSWLDDYSVCAARYNMDGIKLQLAFLDSPEERIDFLHAIVKEMSEPSDVIFQDTIDGDQTITDIRLGYRHGLSLKDVERVQALLREFERTYVMDVLSDLTQRKAQFSARDTYEINAAKRLKWLGSQVDLVFVMDCLRKAGYFNEVDAALPQAFDFDSSAKDIPRNLRNLRLKVRKGESHPQREKLRVLIEALQQGFR